MVENIGKKIMIMYCAANDIYFNEYFDLWIQQCNKFYPELQKIIAVYKPNSDISKRCKQHGVEMRDITKNMIDNPITRDFYLMRWLFLPFDVGENILETQINCLPVKKQHFEEQKVEHLRISRRKFNDLGYPGTLGGVSAAVFSVAGAKKVVQQAKQWQNCAPEYDHEMNMWQIHNLTHDFSCTEQQFKIKNKKIKDYTCWITAGTSNKYTAQQKKDVLTHYI